MMYPNSEQKCDKFVNIVNCDYFTILLNRNNNINKVNWLKTSTMRN